MKLESVLTKTKIIQATRAFFEDQGFQEVIIPVLSPNLPLEPNLYPFTTTWRASDSELPLYLAISPEAGLKKMMAAGINTCFAIGHSFRNLEARGPQHSPEFLMLEWYRPHATYSDIMQDVQELLNRIAEKLAVEWLPKKTWPQLSLIDLFRTYAHLDLVAALQHDTFIELATAKGYQTQNATWSQIFDQIFLNEIEPELPQGGFFLVDFPSLISPLCAPQTQRPEFAQRFEVYVNGLELGNGNTENLDRSQVEQAFQREQTFRQQKGLIVPPIDVDFLASLTTLKHRYDSVAGIGLGIERLAMIMAQTKNIEDVTELENFKKN